MRKAEATRTAEAEAARRLGCNDNERCRGEGAKIVASERKSSISAHTTSSLLLLVRDNTISLLRREKGERAASTFLRPVANRHT